MGVRWENKAAFFKKLQQTVPGIGNDIRVANAKSAELIANSAKALAPPADTGNLQESIRWGKGRGPTAYIVQAGGELTTKPVRKGTSVSYDYAIGVEFGTKHMAKQPFFWPSYRLNKRSFKGRLTRSINKGLKRIGWRTT